MTAAEQILEADRWLERYRGGKRRGWCGELGGLLDLLRQNGRRFGGGRCFRDAGKGISRLDFKEGRGRLWLWH